MYQCEKCSKCFSNQRDRKYHWRKEHQESVTINLPDRTRFIVHRSISNDISGFSCPIQSCDAFLENPQSLRKHVLQCSRLASVTHRPTPDQDQDQQDPTPISSLTLYDISFIAELSILVCRKCQYVLSPISRPIRQHIRDKHTGTTPSLAFVKQALLLIEAEICSANHP
uniref:C2H2-type domain-containing protein n=1 Tax=Spongospora subterranea TaxID=70186 RepID=A0A0H5QXI9_9EUKA|eukprot:CRZ06452.1 hypothetical protein [Spongospora subterranea]